MSFISKYWWYFKYKYFKHGLRIVQWFHGAKKTKTGDFVSTSGKYVDANANIEFDGACPVQGFGKVNGHSCYYRSRGSGWSFEIYSTNDPDGEHAPIWYYNENCYYWPDGGWVTAEVSCQCIERALKEFRSSRFGKMLMAVE